MDFTQINAGINRKIISQALRLLELNEEDTVSRLVLWFGQFYSGYRPRSEEGRRR